MSASVPIIEVAHDTDTLSHGRPYGEASAGHTVDHAEVCAELVIDAPLSALAEKVQVYLPEGREERIRIAAGADVILAVFDYEIVSVNLLDRSADAFEDIGLAQALELDDGFVLLMRGRGFDTDSLRGNRANDDPLAVREDVHSQQFVRGPVLDLDQTSQLGFAKNHRVQDNPSAQEATPKSAIVAGVRIRD
jgi:hypothetical protein